MPNTRSSLQSPRTKSYVLQNGRCYYCGYPMWNGQSDEFSRQYGIKKRALGLFRCTGEHLIPHSEGGSASQENIVAACAFCNKQRHHRKQIPSPEQFRTHVSNRVRQGRWHTKVFLGPMIGCPDFGNKE